MFENVWYAACLAGLWVLGTRGAAGQVLPAGHDCSAAFGPRHQLIDSVSLSETNPFVGAFNGGLTDAFYYPDAAALFNLTHACCPRGSFISEWEATLKTFKVPSPFGDGRIRSLNGTILDDYYNISQGVYKDYITRFDYKTWPSENLGSNSTLWDISWDDVQGIALSTLQNYTILGSLAAKCSLGNGTVVAQLPIVGSNFTGNCFNPPGLEVTESQPIRIINSTISDGSFAAMYYDNQLKLPVNVTSSGRFISNRDLIRQYGYQQSPYQDFMGLMRILEITAENAPEVVDVAPLDLSRVTVDSYLTLIQSDQAEQAVELSSWVAMNGFSAMAGCYGPVEIQVFAEPKLLDVAPLPEATSYQNCSRGEREAYDNDAYEGAGSFLPHLDLDTEYFSGTDRFSKTPRVCCPDGEYITSFDLEFSGDPSYSSKDSNGSYPKRLWGIAGVCSSGIRLPAISGGNGCAGRDGLLPASNYTVKVPYDNEEEGSGAFSTSIGFRSDDLGIISFGGVDPNASASTSGSIHIGAYDDKSTKPRIVGLEATASCNALSSLGLVLRPLEQIQPSGGGGGGGLSGGAIAGIVIGVVAAVALLACAIFLILQGRARHRGSSIETLPFNAHQ